MTTLHRRKHGETFDTDESSDSSEDKDSADTESAPEPDKVVARHSSKPSKCLHLEDCRSSSSGSLGQIKSWYDRECAERATASSAFMEMVKTHLKNTEDNQKQTISLLERLVDKA